MHLYNGRNFFIKLFKDKYINPTNFSYNAKLEPEPELKLELEYESEYEPEFEKTIAERVKKKTKKT